MRNRPIGEDLGKVPAPVRPGVRGAPAACVSWLVASLASATVAAAQEQDESASVGAIAQRQRAVVTRLASPEFAGRSGEGGQKAADFLIEEFQKLKLPGLFQGSYSQSVPGLNAQMPRGRNVGALLAGGDPNLKQEWVILSAHFDHLGVRHGHLYPGADDNASGVAMMLEIARSLARGPQPRRSVAFIGFDLEEIGLFGSRYFVAHSPMPLTKIVLFVTADMLGGSLADLCPNHLFVMGCENATNLLPWIQSASQRTDLKLGVLGADLLLLNRSDYGPFRSSKIPFLFFTTGESPRYHTPRDTADSLNYSKLAKSTQVIHQVVLSALQAPEPPRWRPIPENPFQEAQVIQDVLTRLDQNQEKLKLKAAQIFLIQSTLKMLEPVLERGSLTPRERAQIIQSARLVLMTVI